jgi:hypothetical protein
MERKKFSWRQRLNIAKARSGGSGSVRVVTIWVWWSLVLSRRVSSYFHLSAMAHGKEWHPVDAQSQSEHAI